MNRAVSTKHLRIERVIHAPRELVFRAWTDPAMLEKWFAPDGCTVEIRTFDARPGGKLHLSIVHPQYGACWTMGEFTEVDPPAKLVYWQAFTDETAVEMTPGELGRGDVWPQRTTATITFTEAEGGTLVIIEQNVDEELAKATGAYPSWLQMLDRLQSAVDAA